MYRSRRRLRALEDVLEACPEIADQTSAVRSLPVLPDLIGRLLPLRAIPASVAAAHSTGSGS
jgi:hypothetical protein